MDIGPILDLWRKVFTVDFLRYFLTAAPFYVLFWMWRPRWLRGRRLQSSDPGRDRIASEMAYSLSTVVIFSAIGLSLVYAQQAGLTRIYLNLDERGWAYFCASIAVAIVAHDAYFYWTHRLLHWRPLYRFAHHVHHRSTSPTPWAACGAGTRPWRPRFVPRHHRTAEGTPPALLDGRSDRPGPNELRQVSGAATKSTSGSLPV